MKLSDIKKELGSGVIIWIECFRGDKVEAVVHNPKDIEYNSRNVYVFEEFKNPKETESAVVKTICEKYGVDKVLVYQKCFVGTSSVDRELNTLFYTGDSHDVFDCDCSYLVSVKKSVADKVPEDGEEFFITLKK